MTLLISNDIISYRLVVMSSSFSRSALDVMRLVELLLVLIVEGRKALPKTPHPSLMAKRMDSISGDRSHRQVIEAIRAGNNDEFYECMDAGKGSSEDTVGLLIKDTPNKEHNRNI